ncbi:MAG TPA: hypothetical protein VGG19_07960 [Tepidisphaeraceae bacterium]|jgi:hypothetical protein
MSRIEPLELKPSAQVMAPTSYVRPWLTWEKVEWFDLQWAHRIGTVALLILIASLAGAIKDQGPYGLGLAAAVVIADVGLIGGILAWWTSRRLSRRSWEPIGVIVFNLVILVVALGIYVIGHFGYLQSGVQWMMRFVPAG